MYITDEIIVCDCVNDCKWKIEKVYDGEMRGLCTVTGYCTCIYTVDYWKKRSRDVFKNGAIG